MEADEKNLLLVLNEVRKMNCLQIESKKSIDKMIDQINYYQDLFDSMVTRSNKNTNQSVVREIRANLLRLSILANPKTAAMYRSSKMESSIVESLYSYGKDKPLQTTPESDEIVSNTEHPPESSYLTSTGFQSIEPNSYLMVKISNPLGSGKLVRVLSISGGGLISTTIEMILDGFIKFEGMPLSVSNFNTGLENNSVALARHSIEGVDSVLGGNVIMSSIQANRMTIIDLEGRLIIIPDHCIIIRIMNRTRRTNSVSLNFSWRETLVSNKHC